MTRIFDLFAKFRKDSRGVSAVEAGFVFPIMVLMLMAVSEITFGYIADRKLTTASQAAVDLVTQLQVVDTAALNDIYEASQMTIEPFDRNDLGLVLTGVQIDSGGRARVAWSNAHGPNVTPKRAGSPITLPPTLITPNSFVVVGETGLEYKPATAFFVKTAYQLEDTFFMRPRLGDGITCLDC